MKISKIVNETLIAMVGVKICGYRIQKFCQLKMIDDSVKTLIFKTISMLRYWNDWKILNKEHK